jgi:chemotaxis protein histidine kinase CheA
MTRVSFVDSTHFAIDTPVQMPDSLRLVRDRLTQLTDRVWSSFSEMTHQSQTSGADAAQMNATESAQATASTLPDSAPSSNPIDQAPEAIAWVSNAAQRTWETLQTTTTQATQTVMAKATSLSDRTAHILADTTSQTRQSLAEVAAQTQSQLSDVTHQTQNWLTDTAQQTTEQVIDASTAFSARITEQASAQFEAIAQRWHAASATVLTQADQWSDRLSESLQTSLAAIPQQWVAEHPVLIWLVGHPLWTLGLSLLSLVLFMGLIRAIARSAGNAWFATVDAPYTLGGQVLNRVNRVAHQPNATASQDELVQLLNRLEAIGREQNQILRQIATLVGKTQK